MIVLQDNHYPFKIIIAVAIIYVQHTTYTAVTVTIINIIMLLNLGIYGVLMHDCTMHVESIIIIIIKVGYSRFGSTVAACMRGQFGT